MTQINIYFHLYLTRITSVKLGYRNCVIKIFPRIIQEIFVVNTMLWLLCHADFELMAQTGSRSVTCKSNVSSMSSVCLLCVPCVSHVYLLYVPCLSPLCLLYAPGCPLCVSYHVCMSPVSCMPPVCLLYVPCVSPVCLLYVSCFMYHNSKKANNKE